MTTAPQAPNYKKLIIILSVILALMVWAKLCHAQTVPVVGEKPAPLSVIGYPGNSFTAVINFPSTAPASLSAAVYQLGSTSKLSARQPVVSRNGNQATVVFPMPNSILDWVGWAEIDWEGGHRIAGRVVVNRQSIVGRITSQTFSVGTTQPVSVSLTSPSGVDASQTAGLASLNTTVSGHTVSINNNTNAIAQNTAAINQRLRYQPAATFAAAKALITPGTAQEFRIASNELYGAPTLSVYDGANWYHAPSLQNN